MGAAHRGVAAPRHTRPQDCTVRYEGYKPEDRARPYASFMAERTAPAQQHVLDCFDGPPVEEAAIPPFTALQSDLRSAGYSDIETGYGRRADGVLFAAVRTEMPRVTPAMCDWWFGWHSVETARYKLWHPDAHRYAAMRHDLTGADRPDKLKYIANTTYVDEYVGPKLQQLAIAFRDPLKYGFDVPSDQTLIFGRVGSSVAPVDLGWLAHQVRPIAGGSEMRSRFYLNMRGMHVPNLVQAACAVRRGASVDPADLTLSMSVARDLLLHCGEEMNHLAQFLPELHAQFS